MDGRLQEHWTGSAHIGPDVPHAERFAARVILDDHVRVDDTHRRQWIAIRLLVALTRLPQSLLHDLMVAPLFCPLVTESLFPSFTWLGGHLHENAECLRLLESQPQREHSTGRLDRVWPDTGPNGII